MSKIPIIIGVVVLLIVFGLGIYFMMGGEEAPVTTTPVVVDAVPAEAAAVAAKAPAEAAAVAAKAPVVPVIDPDEKICSRNVSAKRLDAPGAGWGMNLHFKCGESIARIGNNSSSGVKTTPQPINISKSACPKTVNKSNWSGTDTYPDKFEISVSDCLA